MKRSVVHTVSRTMISAVFQLLDIKKKMNVEIEQRRAEMEQRALKVERERMGRAGEYVDRVGFNSAVVKDVLARTFLKNEAEHVLALVIERMQMRIPIVDMREVRVCGVSSSDLSVSSHPSHTLMADDSMWWISQQRFEGGRGYEYIDYSFGQVVQVCVVKIKIPPLPHGPLSVRDFCLESWDSNANDFVRNRAHRFMTQDTRKWQSFLLDPPIESSRVRLACLSNAAAAYSLFRQEFNNANAVGFFQICFC